jgi:hypothetical protein
LWKYLPRLLFALLLAQAVVARERLWLWLWLWRLSQGEVRAVELALSSMKRSLFRRRPRLKTSPLVVDMDSTLEGESALTRDV